MSQTKASDPSDPATKVGEGREATREDGRPSSSSSPCSERSCGEGSNKDDGMCSSSCPSFSSSPSNSTPSPSFQPSHRSIEERIAAIMRKDYMNIMCATVWKRISIYVIGSEGKVNRYILNGHQLSKMRMWIRDVKSAVGFITEYVRAKEGLPNDQSISISVEEIDPACPTSSSSGPLDRLTKVQYILVRISHRD